MMADKVVENVMETCSFSDADCSEKLNKSTELIRKVWLANKPKKIQIKRTKPTFIVTNRCPFTGKRILKNEKRKRKSNNTSKSRKSDNDAVNPSIDYIPSENVDIDDVDVTSDEDTGGNDRPNGNEWIKQLLSLIGPKNKPKRSWFKRTESSQDDWDKVRNNIWTNMQARDVLGDTCFVCNEKTAKIYCFDCIDSLCPLCDHSIHEKEPCHDRMVDGKFLSPTDGLGHDNEIIFSGRCPRLNCPCSVCGGNNLEKILQDDICIVVTLKGRFDLNKYFLRCKQCEHVTDPFTVSVALKSGYWPGNARHVNYLFKEEVLKLWDMFRKFMPGSSERSFLKSLNAISDENFRKATIIPNNFSMAFKEWCLWSNRKDEFQLKNWLECPACDGQQHSCHVDGNCKLYRFKRGRRKRKSFYEGKFFVPNEEVSKFIKGVYGDQRNVINDSTCGGSWTAAKNISRKMAKLDETGLEVATCRHVIAQKALNMYRGEVFGYPLYLIKNFMVERNVKFCFADVMCKLWPFICKNEPSLASKIRPALSVMHAKGHAMECQVVWSGEWLDGTGRSTGEETEQLFSYLSRFGNTTKHQSPENREETITEAVFHWNKIKVIKMVSDLKKRYLKNEERLESITISSKISELTIKSWIEDIKKEAKGLKFRNSRQLSNEEKALLLIENLQTDDHLNLVNSMAFPCAIAKIQYFRLLEFDRNDQKELLEKLRPLATPVNLMSAHESLRSDIWKPLLEALIERCRVEKSVVSAQIQNLADSCKRRRTVRGKLEIINNKEKGLLKDMKNLFPNFGNLPTEGCVGNSEAIERRAIAECFLKKQHAIEEKEIIIDEMKKMLDYFRRKMEQLRSECNNDNSNNDNSFKSHSSPNEILDIPGDSFKKRYFEGSINLKRQGLSYFRHQLELSLKTFLPIIDPGSVHNIDELLGSDDYEDELAIDLDDKDDDYLTSDDESPDNEYD